MNKDTAITDIVKSLGSKKYNFLNEVESAIDSKISNSSISDCLSIVIRYDDGSSVTWRPSEVLDGYLPRFLAFIRKEKYKGHVVDSYLTDRVVNVVTSKFEAFYKDNSDIIAKSVLNLIISDHSMSKSLTDSIIDSTSGALPTVFKNQLSALLLERLEDTMLGGIIHTASDTVTTWTAKAVSAAAAIPISKAMAMLIVKHMAILMKGTIAKVLASTALKTMLATSIKKLVAVKIIGAAITLFASKVGLTSTASIIGWIVAPLIIAFLAHEVYTLPSKMGEKVAKEVRNELDGKFSNLNRDVVSSIVNTVLYSGLSQLTSQVANDPKMKDLINQFVAATKQ